MPRATRLPSSLPSALAAAGVLLLAVGCGEDPDYSAYENAQEESTAEGATAVAGAGSTLDGGEFNRFFPEDQGEFDVIPRQEKTGTAVYTVERDEVEIAELTVTDTNSNPSARDKYADSETEIGGYPVVTVGSKRTSALVGDRYQVQVVSKTDDFTEADRKLWLEKFDLDGIAALK